MPIILQALLISAAFVIGIGSLLVVIGYFRRKKVLTRLLTVAWPKTNQMRLRVLLAGVGIYLCLWMVTALAGTRQARNDVLRHLKIPSASTDISATTPSNSDFIVESEVATPYHWCITRSYVPFLVVARAGVNPGGPCVRGENVLYFWFLGYTKAIRGTAWIT